MKRTIRIVSLLIILTGFQWQANGQTLPVACGGSRVRYGTSGFPNSVFNWEVQGGTIFNNYNDSVDIEWDNTNGPKAIKVTEYTAYNCIGAPVYGSVEVKVPTVIINGKLSVCAGQLSTLEPKSNYVSYLWSTKETTKNISVSIEGPYKLQVTDSSGCVATDSVYLSVLQAPKVNLGRDTVLCERQTLTLDAGSEGSFYQWLYDDKNYYSRTIEVELGAREISVEVRNDIGCIGRDTINILACRHSEVDIPNAFTPNGDGDNDTWRISKKSGNMTLEYLEDRPNIIIEIFDRWGRRVFYSKNALPSGGWDGSFNGRNLPMDSYYYIIRWNNGAEPTIGNVTIIR